MGGTRFVGKALVQRLQFQNHDLTLFTRGKNALPSNVEHVRGDRKNDDDLNLLKGRAFDVIIDSSGRTVEDTRKVVERTGAPKYRLLYVSSAGVYSNSNYLPVNEEDNVDPSSRHIGKVETESWLIKEKIPFTSFRPTYIYGPGNYNPIERWFFDRITHEQPIPLPGDGQTITQLGHVFDLANAMAKSLDIEKSKNTIYNCSGQKGVTFTGLVEAMSLACGRDPAELKIIKFDPSILDPKARKSFPIRIEHFLTDITRIQQELDWSPKYDLLTGLVDSYQNDYMKSPTIRPDFESDKLLIGV